VAIYFRSADGQTDRLVTLAGDIVGPRVAVIIMTEGGAAALAAYATTTTIPGDRGRSVMANKDIIIGRVINITGMIGVLAGTVLFTFAIVLILFRRGFGLDIPNSIHWFW
jgi:hypothetical protein